jgi:CRISPR-associated protein Csb2
MPVIELRFPAGRFHATPWGRHVNEGAVEWPPSPWRILRALIATWYLKTTREEVPETAMRALAETLVEHAVTYQLPPASLGHTRHYMPIIEGSNQKTTKVFDTFIHAAGPLRMKWDAPLTSDQRRVLALLCERLGYLGRAESLVEATLLADDAAFAAHARPLPENEPVPAGHELVRVLAPRNEADFQRWRATLAPVPAPAEAAPKPKPKRATKKNDGPKLPADLFAALHADTGDLQAAGWTLPPGARMLDYVRREDCFDLAPARPQPRLRRPTVARFAVASNVLPRLTRAVSVAERVHQALVSRFKGGPAPAVFTGLGPDGQPQASHRHAFIFCEANGARDAVTHVTVFARDGFDAPARWALASLQRVWGHGGHDLQLVLLGFGEPETFVDSPVLNAGKPARVWQSLTPFVPTRHPKTFRDGRPKLDADGWAIGSPEHDLRRLIGEARDAANCPLPPPLKLEAQPHLALNGRRLSALEFQAERHHGGGAHAGQTPRAFKITFAAPVCGPLAFGHAAHFGLGLFIPVPPP